MRTRKKLATLTATTALLMGLGVTAAVANHSPTAPAAIECLGTATVEEVDSTGATTGRGITFPVTGDGLVEPARDFRWSLDAEDCVVENAEGVTFHDLNVKGTGNGWCGHSTAPSSVTVPGYTNSGTLGSVAISNIEWVSAGSVLVVTGDHDGHLPNGDPAVGTLVAEVEAFGGQDCSTTSGATTFTVVIVGEAA